MTNSLKFRISNWYIFSGLIIPIGVFLFTTLFLLFAKLELKDFLPIVFLDSVFFLLAIVSIKHFLKMAGNELTALELNDEEIIDYISNVRVSWDNVSDICFVGQAHSDYISIVLRDKKAPIYQTKNIFKKGVFYINILFSGTPIKIFPGYVKGKNSEIFDQISAYSKGALKSKF